MTFDERSRRVARWRDVATQFALVFGAAIFYFLVRGVTQGSVERAERNARAILRAERALGIDVEMGAQALIVGQHVLVMLANWVYIWGHWPVVIATLYSLHRWRPQHYLMLRNALFVSGAIGIVIYITFPVAPPRLLGSGYQDTVTQFSTSYRLLQPPALVNKYAAMPSLHAGWNLLAGIALFSAVRHRGLRLVSVLGPVAMALAVVFTGNHYVLDVVAGEVVALVGLALSQRWWPLVDEADAVRVRVDIDEHSTDDDSTDDDSTDDDSTDDDSMAHCAVQPDRVCRSVRRSVPTAKQS
jgi:membrane-associated phospholipid phosphatase